MKLSNYINAIILISLDFILYQKPNDIICIGTYWFSSQLIEVRIQSQVFE